MKNITEFLSTKFDKNKVNPMFQLSELVDCKREKDVIMILQECEFKKIELSKFSSHNQANMRLDLAKAIEYSSSTFDCPMYIHEPGSWVRFYNGGEISIAGEPEATNPIFYISFSEDEVKFFDVEVFSVGNQYLVALDNTADDEETCKKIFVDALNKTYNLE